MLPGKLNYTIVRHTAESSCLGSGWGCGSHGGTASMHIPCLPFVHSSIQPFIHPTIHPSTHPLSPPDRESCLFHLKIPCTPFRETHVSWRPRRSPGRGRTYFLLSARCVCWRSGADNRDPLLQGWVSEKPLNLLSPRVCSPHLLEVPRKW